MKTYTTSALARISGISRDQLMNWNRAGLLCPERRSRGDASEMIYTREQALGVMALGELRRRGVSDRRIRGAAGLLPAVVAEFAYLVFDGQTVSARSTDAEVLELLGRLDGGGRLLRVAELAERLA